MDIIIFTHIWDLSMSDLERLKIEYERRKNSLTQQTLYSLFNSASLFAVQQRQQQMLNLLRYQGIDSLKDKNILEMGCGNGGVLLEYLTYSAESNKIVGIDLLHDRLLDGSKRFPSFRLTCADGQKLPFKEKEFDIVLQYTAFSSVLDPQVKANMAKEMLRVLTKNGIVIWYDFWLNPINPETAGIKPNEIKALFPNCDYTFRKITLAPPITRRIIKVSQILCMLLEKMTIFNSHYLAIIKPKN